MIFGSLEIKPDSLGWDQQVTGIGAYDRPHLFQKFSFLDGSTKVEWRFNVRIFPYNKFTVVVNHRSENIPLGKSIILCYLFMMS